MLHKSSLVFDTNIIYHAPLIAECVFVILKLNRHQAQIFSFQYVITFHQTEVFSFEITDLSISSHINHHAFLLPFNKNFK